ncbi:MAG TPA: hypothetical protein VMF52_06545 [Steroidobacteraceae bacterium]|nr:hypothetical protein [Steroidobacteraceae bacterium]
MKSFALFGVLAVCGCIAGPAAAARAVCGDTLGRGHRAQKTITPSFERFGPSYYLHVDGFVMLLRPQDIVDKLGQLKKLRKPGDAEALIAAIQADLPLRAETDLFKYTFIAPERMELIDFAVDQLLEEGRVGVFGLRALGDPSAASEPILRVSVNTADNDLAERVFCTRSQQVLHQVRFAFD